MSYEENEDSANGNIQPYIAFLPTELKVRLFICDLSALYGFLMTSH